MPRVFALVVFDHELVRMRAGRQRDDFFPDSVFPAFHFERGVRHAAVVVIGEVVEIAREIYLLRVFRFEREQVSTLDRSRCGRGNRRTTIAQRRHRVVVLVPAGHMQIGMPRTLPFGIRRHKFIMDLAGIQRQYLPPHAVTAALHLAGRVAYPAVVVVGPVVEVAGQITLRASADSNVKRNPPATAFGAPGPVSLSSGEGRGAAPAARTEAKSSTVLSSLSRSVTNGSGCQAHSPWSFATTYLYRTAPG